MYNVTLVSTHHTEYGKCNSEELTPDLFDKLYKDNIIPLELEPPEIKSVKKYIQYFTTSHIPVDINLIDSLSSSEVSYMFKTVGKYHVYSKIEEEHKKLAYEGGYEFLNSKQNEELVEKKKALEIKLIELQINKDRLSRIHELFYQEQHNREEEILKNIYTYSKQITYNQGLLLIGAGHRKTIFEKIKKYETRDNVKLHWTLYGN